MRSRSYSRSCGQIVYMLADNQLLCLASDLRITTALLPRSDFSMETSTEILITDESIPGSAGRPGWPEESKERIVAEALEHGPTYCSGWATVRPKRQPVGRLASLGMVRSPSPAGNRCESVICAAADPGRDFLRSRSGRRASGSSSE